MKAGLVAILGDVIPPHPLTRILVQREKLPGTRTDIQQIAHDRGRRVDSATRVVRPEQTAGQCVLPVGDRKRQVRKKSKHDTRSHRFHSHDNLPLLATRGLILGRPSALSPLEGWSTFVI